MEHYRNNMDKETTKKNILLEIIKKVIQETGFNEILFPPELEPYYVELASKHPDRCVDGRKALEKFAERYKGAQLAGGSLGMVDVLRIIMPHITEEKIRKIIEKTYSDNGLVIGAHIDDKHGEIKDSDELNNRTEGCGNQMVVANGKVDVASELKVTPELVKGRITWVRSLEDKGVVVTLTGHHQEKVAVVNFISGTTFDTQNAENSEAFNMDLATVYDRAGLIFETLELEHEDLGNKENFQEVFTKVAFTDYLQTLSALGAPKTVAIRS